MNTKAMDAIVWNGVRLSITFIFSAMDTAVLKSTLCVIPANKMDRRIAGMILENIGVIAYDHPSGGMCVDDTPHTILFSLLIADPRAAPLACDDEKTCACILQCSVEDVRQYHALWHDEIHITGEANNTPLIDAIEHGRDDESLRMHDITVGEFYRTVMFKMFSLNDAIAVQKRYNAAANVPSYAFMAAFRDGDDSYDTVFQMSTSTAETIKYALGL
jgi:hypothetical protein